MCVLQLQVVLPGAVVVLLCTLQLAVVLHATLGHMPMFVLLC
jgi:hypothetical protein